MSEAVDYFSNHALKLRFPWRLYHQPIVEALQRAIAGAPGPDVLNVGSGPFLELSRLDTGPSRFTLCDIDARAIEVARELHGARLARTDVIPAGAPLPYPEASFDLVVSMDVIEHLGDPRPWLRELVRVLRPGGHLFLTTPNYGSMSLTILELTALELIARIQGFSRRHLHPTKFTAQRLRHQLAAEGLDRIIVTPIALGWVLSAFAIRNDAEGTP
ncbi:MAG: class I SAM-dependent methyltransferase [Myxococcota bacterium]